MSRLVDAAQVAALQDSLCQLLAEWESSRSLLGISSKDFWRPDPGHALGLSLLGVSLDNPFGSPWTSRSTSLNEVTEQWLRGCRVFEVADALEFGVAAQMLLAVLNHRDVLAMGSASTPLFLHSRGSGSAFGVDDEREIVEALRVALPEAVRTLAFPKLGARGVTLSVPRGFPIGELATEARRLLEAGTPVNLEVDAGGADTPLDRGSLREVVRDLLDFRDALAVQPKLGVQLSDGGTGTPDGAFLKLVEWLVDLRMTFGGNLPVSVATALDPLAIPEVLALGLAPIYLRGADWEAVFPAAYGGMDAAGVTLREELIHAKSGGCADRAMCLVGNAAIYQEQLRTTRT